MRIDIQLWMLGRNEEMRHYMDLYRDDRLVRSVGYLQYSELDCEMRKVVRYYGMMAAVYIDGTPINQKAILTEVHSRG